MDLDDIIVSESVVENITPIANERKEYPNAYPSDYVGSELLVNQFKLNPMKVDAEKEKKNGGTFYSSRCILECYVDDEKIKMPFFIENFTNYNAETDLLTVSGVNVLARLVKKIRGTSSNKFTLKYGSLREFLSECTDIPVTVAEYATKGGFVSYTLE